MSIGWRQFDSIAPNFRQAGFAHTINGGTTWLSAGVLQHTVFRSDATGDFNGDGKPDYVLYNGDTRQTAIWYLNNNVFVNGAYGPTLPSG